MADIEHRLLRLAQVIHDQADNLSPSNDVHPAGDMRKWARYLRANAAAAKSLIAEIESLRNENERLQNLVFVPGLWRCAKCDFRLVQSNLNMRSGTVTARDDAGDKCPNCDAPLWRVSAMDDRNEAFRTANDTFDRLESLRKRLDAAEGVVNRYRYAVAWSASDSWDHCPECRARFEWARSSDDGAHLDDKALAAVSGAFLHGEFARSALSTEGR